MLTDLVKRRILTSKFEGSEKETFNKCSSNIYAVGKNSVCTLFLSNYPSKGNETFEVDFIFDSLLSIHTIFSNKSSGKAYRKKRQYILCMYSISLK